MKRLKIKKQALFIIGAIVLIIIARFAVKESKIKPVESKHLDTFTMGYEKYTIEKGEELTVNAWNDLEIMYNNETYDTLPTIANGVTIGTNYKDVLKIFGIQDGYAIANMEVPTKQEDGTTDIIEKTYRNKSIFKKDYLDLYLLFGYKKVNKEWKMVTAKELKKLMDTDKEILVFYIDFNGMDNEVVNPGEVISFSITHQ